MKTIFSVALLAFAFNMSVSAQEVQEVTEAGVKDAMNVLAQKSADLSRSLYRNFNFAAISGINQRLEVKKAQYEGASQLGFKKTDLYDQWLQIEKQKISVLRLAADESGLQCEEGQINNSRFREVVARCHLKGYPNEHFWVGYRFDGVLSVIAEKATTYAYTLDSGYRESVSLVGVEASIRKSDEKTVTVRSCESDLNSGRELGVCLGNISFPLRPLPSLREAPAEPQQLADAEPAR